MSDPQRIKILYVDDEPGNLTAFKASFRRDFEILVANSAEEGLAILEKQPVHVVISDQRMPRTTGSEFLAKVRERHPQSMRMLLTGYSDIEAVIEAVNKGGIFAYVTKPWEPTDLKMRIQQAAEVLTLRDQRSELDQRYRQVFDSSGDPIVIMDVSGRLRDANPAAKRTLGLTASMISNLAFHELLTSPDQFNGKLASLKEPGASLALDLTIRTPDGREIDCLVSTSRLGSADDDQAVYQAMIKDISDRKQEEMRLRKLNDDLDKRVTVRTRQLLDALEDLGSFSYTVAHDLRSPLKNILALSEHLNELSNDGQPEQGEAANRIKRGAERMIQLVDDLLRFSQTNTRQIQHEPFQVRALFESCIEDHVPAERKHQIKLIAGSDETLTGDSAMLHVALGNLLSNAIKYTRNVPSPVIEIGHRNEGNEHLLWVRDNGVGFDAGATGKVFEVFKRMHRSDQFEGTGVGLAIVQRIIAKHGGNARAESTPGKGTLIILSLPKTQTQEHALPFAS